MKFILKTNPGQGAILRLLALEFLALGLQLMRLLLNGEVAPEPEYVLITIVSITITIIAIVIGLPSKVLSASSTLYLNGIMVFSIIFNTAINDNPAWNMVATFAIIVYSYQQSITLLNKKFLFVLLGVNIIFISSLVYWVAVSQVIMLVIIFALFGAITYFVYEWSNNQKVVVDLKDKTDYLERETSHLKNEKSTLQVNVTELENDIMGLQTTVTALKDELALARQQNNVLFQLFQLLIKFLQSPKLTRISGIIDSHPKEYDENLIQFWLESEWGPVYVKWVPMPIILPYARQVEKGDRVFAIGIPGGERKKNNMRVTIFWAFQVFNVDDDSLITKLLQVKEQVL